MFCSKPGSRTGYRGLCSKPCKRRAEGRSAFTVHDQAKRRRVRPAESSVEPQRCLTDAYECISTHQCSKSHMFPFPDKVFIKNVSQCASRLRAEGTASCENKKIIINIQINEQNIIKRCLVGMSAGAQPTMPVRPSTTAKPAMPGPLSCRAQQWCIRLGYENLNTGSNLRPLLPVSTGYYSRRPVERKHMFYRRKSSLYNTKWRFG